MVVSENNAPATERVGWQSKARHTVVCGQASQNVTFCERSENRCEVQRWNDDENQESFDAMISNHGNAQ